jgi:hypothetical protein
MDVLPDDVLHEIFYFYIRGKPEIEAWQSLVHVCRRWRSLVFQSPRRLNLRVVCKPDTPDVWPALPLVFSGNMDLTDDIVAAHSNRVCEVDLWDLAAWRLEKVIAAMQVPFPELTGLWLHSFSERLPVIPDSFLGGSAPRLRYFSLSGIPFPGLPKLLLSANHLVSLWLSNIPHSGYISPEAMIALLSVLTDLETLSLQFQSPQSRPDSESRSLPPPKRSILPALDQFYFDGVTEYLEDLVTFIDAPQLKTLNIAFFSQVDFDSPGLAQFINRTPSLRALDEAHVQFYDSSATVKLRYRTSKSGSYDLLIHISCREPEQQLSSIEQVCNPSTVEELYIEHQYSQLVWRNDTIENSLWLDLLLPFTAVKNLYLSEEFAPGVVAALQELVGSRITEVLPSLQNIFVEGLDLSGPLQENIGQFVAARQLSGHPIAISKYSKSRPW